jgi:uncharacterized DUF497 family protein
LYVDFRWNRWNLEHATRHGVDPGEAQRVVTQARSPFPLCRADDKWLVWGRGRGGRLLQVVFVLDDDETVYVIHARPLTDREKRHYRRRMSR